jgi:hypothetical protein
VGGVCGYSNNSTINNCYNAAAVTGDSDVGGVCGYNASYITACYNTGAVSGDSDVGGVCGENSQGAISNCYNTGAVSGTDATAVGGVGGWNYKGTITACHNTGAVTGDSSVGGVCGSNYGTTTACYNTGAVSGGTPVGGVCGVNDSYGTITACYWHDVSGGTINGIGTNNGSAGEAFKFGGGGTPGEGGWPVEDYTASWGIGTNTTGYYWKWLGFWNGGSPVFPKLWWE